MNNKKLTLIQVFRGIASLLVVGVHGELIFNQNLEKDFLFNIFHFGGSGVDFFFVLSGFIIYYVHQKDLGRPNKIKQFCLKRLIRIYPIYWVILTGKIAASVSLSYGDISERSWLDILQAFTLFPQDRKILSQSFLGVSWTLSYEIFFYIIFGFLIYFGLKKCLPLLVLWLAMVLLNFGGMISISQDNILGSFLFSYLHIEFVLGLIAAHIISNYTLNNGHKILCTGLFLFTLSAINYNYEILQISDLIAFAIPSALLIVGASALEMKKSVDIAPFLMLLGNASYSLYLVHGFAINNFTRVMMKLGIVENIIDSDLLMGIFAVINIAIAVLAGIIVYLYIEKPMINVLRKVIISH